MDYDEETAPAATHAAAASGAPNRKSFVAKNGVLALQWIVLSPFIAAALLKYCVAEAARHLPAAAVRRPPPARRPRPARHRADPRPLLPCAQLHLGAVCRGAVEALALAPNAEEARARGLPAAPAAD